MKKQNTVRVQSDTSTLLHALQATFTDHAKVLGELLQNGRRAKATRIDITVTDKAIVFADDGVGIEDPSVLLSIAKSGWDEGTMKDDSPYGIGWLSCLFACETVSVQSKGKHLIAMTEDLMALKPVVVNESAEIGVTEIRLLNHRLGCVSIVVSRIKSLVRGFPIPVFVNEEEAARPDALEVGEWIEGEISFIRRSHALDLGSNPRYFLQGQPIHIRSQSYGNNPIHLKSPQVKGRLPERDCVLEPVRVNEALKVDARNAAINQAQYLASVLDFATLRARADVLAELDLLHLLDAGGELPGDLLSLVHEHPQLDPDTYSPWFISSYGEKGLEALKTSGKKIYVLEGCDSAEELLGLHYVRAADGLVLLGKYGGREQAYISWLRRYAEIIEVDCSQFEITPIEQVGEGDIDLYEVNGVVFAKAVALSHPDLPTQTLKECAIFDTKEGILCVTEGSPVNTAVCQCSDFLDEDDRVDEAYRDQNLDELHLQMLEIFGSAEPHELFAQVLTDCLPSLPGSVKGKSFTVTIDAMGKHQVSC